MTQAPASDRFPNERQPQPAERSRQRSLWRLCCELLARRRAFQYTDMAKPSPAPLPAGLSA